MGAKFGSLCLFRLKERSRDKPAWIAYFVDLKRNLEFVCPDFSQTSYSGRHRTPCRHSYSPSSFTLFHKGKFLLLKAFNIVYNLATINKEISSTKLSCKLASRQKTYRLFKTKGNEGYGKQF